MDLIQQIVQLLFTLNHLIYVIFCQKVAYEVSLMYCHLSLMMFSLIEENLPMEMFSKDKKVLYLLSLQVLSLNNFVGVFWDEQVTNISDEWWEDSKDQIQRFEYYLRNLSCCLIQGKTSYYLRFVLIGDEVFWHLNAI